MDDKQQRPDFPPSPPVTSVARRAPTTASPVVGLPQPGLQSVLTAMCSLSSSARGAVVRRVDEGRTEIITLYPAADLSDTYPDWLKPYAAALADVLPSEPPPVALSKTRLIRQPEKRTHGFIWAPGHSTRVEQRWAIVLESEDPSVSRVREILNALVALLDGYGAVTSTQDSQAVIDRLQRAIVVLAAINKPRRFLSAAMTLCNELASEWGCERVSVGLLRGRYVRLKATSHSAHFSRKMQVVQDIESAMEECLDQDLEVIHPASAQVPTIRKAAANLASRHGAYAVASVPLRLDGEPKAIVTLEWPADRAPDAELLTAVRLTCNLCAPRLLNLYRQDRWLVTKLALKTGDVLGLLLGPRHIAAKLITAGVLAALVYVVIGQGTYRAQAPFVLEAMKQQSIVAPFDGYIKGVNVEIGDYVTPTDSNAMASLDTAELKLERAASLAELRGFQKQDDAYTRDGQTAQAQMAQADAERIQARIDLLDHRIQRSVIRTPVNGTVTQGDLKRHVGAPVKTGDVLFEVTPLESLRAVLLVPEDRIHELLVGQTGSLGTAFDPDGHIDFVVEQIYPAAEVVNQRNIFRVRARLEVENIDEYKWLRPGMEGVAKVTIGKRRWVWIWTRKFVNWVRMTLWI